MQTTQLEFKISANESLLDLRAVLDGKVVWQGRPGPDVQDITVELDDAEDRSHVLEFVLSGKTQEHTLVNDAGDITSDVTVRVQDISFDDIAIGQIFSELAEYHHDFNGTQPAIVDQFYGEMGCNGTVSLGFTTPIYLWLLENM